VDDARVKTVLSKTPPYAIRAFYWEIIVNKKKINAPVGNCHTSDVQSVLSDRPQQAMTMLNDGVYRSSDVTFQRNHPVGLFVAFKTEWQTTCNGVSPERIAKISSKNSKSINRIGLCYLSPVIVKTASQTVISSCTSAKT
jgi:hypothetical protein